MQSTSGPPRREARGVLEERREHGEQAVGRRVPAEHGARRGRGRLPRGHRLEQLADHTEAELALEQPGTGVQHGRARVHGVLAQDGEQPRLADPRRSLESQHAAFAQVQPGDAAAIAATSTSRSTRPAGRRPSTAGRGEQPLVQGDELRTGRRPELVAQQHTQLVVAAQRLGDVAARDQRLDLGGASGLAERGHRHGRARAPRAHRRARASVSSACTRSSSSVSRGPRSQGASNWGSSPASVSAAASRGFAARAASTSTHTGCGNAQAQRVAALERGGRDRAAQAGEHGRERGVRRRRALVGPERVDQLVAAHRAVAVQHQVGEREPALLATQQGLTAFTGELHSEFAAEMDAPLLADR